MALASSNSKQLKSSLSLSHRLSEGPFLIICIYLVMAAIYIAVLPSAWSQSSIEALFNNSLPLMLAAAGATFVILHGEFDLSVAGVISLANVVVATVPVSGIGGSAANLAVVIMIGLAVGAINGLFVAYLRIQAIAVTLATMIICKGAALLILRAPGGTVPEFMTNELTSSLFGIVPVAVVVAACVIVFWSIYSRTNTGLALIAIGQDGQAAALSGIDVAWVRFKSFLWAGVFYSLAGYMLAAQTTTGNPNGWQFLPVAVLCFSCTWRNCIWWRARRFDGFDHRSGHVDADAESPVRAWGVVLLHRRRSGSDHDHGSSRSTNGPSSSPTSARRER